MVLINLRLISPVLYKALWLHTKAAGNAGNIVEICDHLSGVVDSDIVETISAQFVQVGGSYTVLVMGESDRILAERLIRLAQWRRAPISCNCVDKSIRLFGGGEEIVNLSTEVVGVCPSSVDTTQFTCNHRGQHLGDNS